LATAELYRQLLRNTEPNDFEGIEGLRFALPTQEEFEESHRLVKPLPYTQPPVQPPSASTQVQSPAEPSVQAPETASSSSSDSNSDSSSSANSESANSDSPTTGQQPGEVQ